MTLSIEASETAGFVFPQVALRAILVIAYGMAGDLATASRVAAQVRAVEEAKPIGDPGNADSAEAWIAVAEGDLEKAGRLLKGKGTSLEDLVQSMVTSPVPLTLAVCPYYLARKDYARALEVIDELTTAFETFQWLALRGFLALARSRALHGLDRSDEARAVLRAAYDETAAFGVAQGLWELEADLSALAAEAGDEAEARRWIHAAAIHIRAVADGLRALGLDERFLARDQVRGILDKA
jgi:hypothetical protein